MITDEELKIYSSLSGREQLDEFNRLMKKDKGKSIKDILEKYEEIWKNTKSENLDVVREYLISTINFFFKTVCVNKINIAIEYDHYLGNLEIENDLDNMLEQLYKQKSLDSVYKYISQLKESKSYFELVKTY